MQQSWHHYLARRGFFLPAFVSDQFTQVFDILLFLFFVSHSTRAARPVSHDFLKDRYIGQLDVLRPVNREGSYQGETKCIPTTSQSSDSLLNTYSTGEDLEKFG